VCSLQLDGAGLAMLAGPPCFAFLRHTISLAVQHADARLDLLGTTQTPMFVSQQPLPCGKQAGAPLALTTTLRSLLDQRTCPTSLGPEM
jgi:hypothetical protein